MLRRLFSIQYLVTVVLATTLLTGCGFQLRGTQVIPEASQKVSLILKKGTSAAFERSLKQTLTRSGIQLVSPAPFTLNILTVRDHRRSITLDSRANTDEYELNFFVEFEVLDDAQKPVSSPLTARVQRIYDYDSDAATASYNLEQEIRREMWSALTTSVLRQYIAVTGTQ